MYHDLGNLNCTFFTRRSRYDRTRNLNIICNAIKEATALNVAVNSRDDIVLGQNHVISTGHQMTNLVLNFEYLLLLCFLIAAKF